MKLISTLVAFALVIMSTSLNAQELDSMLLKSAENFQQEKIHLHFDKSLYSKGETVWFKAYLLAGDELTDYSKTIYFDWYDDNGNLLKHIKSAIFESTARGQFNIPEKYKGQSIHVKAYTNWMLNFDKAFLYNRDIKVYQPFNNKKSITKPVTTVHFFPEGGNVIAGLNINVAFKANNQKGLPVKISKGVIKNVTKGTELVSFKSVHDGMGTFKILAANSTDSLVAYWQDEFDNKGFTVFPKAKAEGASLMVNMEDDKLIVHVSRTENADDRYKSLHIITHLHQQPFAKASINLSEKITATARIPLTDVPTGVMEVTLFNKDWLPIAERVVFVNNHKYEFSPFIHSLSKGLGKRQLNVYEIEVPDTIKSNMSLSVTDAEVASDSSYNIFTDLLLTEDLKGYVHNPSYYFNEDNNDAPTQLDLVMLTNGWRRIKWDELSKGKFPYIPNPKDTDYLQIAGTLVSFSKREKIQNGQQVILIIQQPNGKNQSIILPVKSDRTFKQSGVFFMDTIKVFYKFIGGDPNIGNTSELQLSNGLIKPNPENISENEMMPYLWSTDTAWIAKQKYYAEQRIRMDNQTKSIAMKDIIIQSKAKKNVDVLDEKYASGLFASGDAYQYDVLNDMRAQSSINVFNYLQGQVPGLQISQQSDGETTLKWRGGTTELFLDEMRTEPDFLYSLSMGDIAYIKIFRPPFFGAIGGGAGGAISIYTRKGNDVQSKPGVGIPYKLLEGYTSYKEFYSPDYAVPSSNTTSDIRTTLYWNPFILTDKSTKRVKVEFYNNDITKKHRLVLEGINHDGKLARFEQIIQ